MAPRPSRQANRDILSSLDYDVLEMKTETEDLMDSFFQKAGQLHTSADTHQLPALVEGDANVEEHLQDLKEFFRGRLNHYRTVLDQTNRSFDRTRKAAQQLDEQLENIDVQEAAGRLSEPETQILEGVRTLLRENENVAAVFSSENMEESLQQSIERQHGIIAERCEALLKETTEARSALVHKTIDFFERDFAVRWQEIVGPLEEASNNFRKDYLSMKETLEDQIERGSEEVERLEESKKGLQDENLELRRELGEAKEAEHHLSSESEGRARIQQAQNEELRRQILELQDKVGSQKSLIDSKSEKIDVLRGENEELSIRANGLAENLSRVEGEKEDLLKKLDGAETKQAIFSKQSETNEEELQKTSSQLNVTLQSLELVKAENSGLVEQIGRRDSALAAANEQKSSLERLSDSRLAFIKWQASCFANLGPESIDEDLLRGWARLRHNEQPLASEVTISTHRSSPKLIFLDILPPRTPDLAMVQLFWLISASRPSDIFTFGLQALFNEYGTVPAANIHWLQAGLSRAVDAMVGTEISLEQVKTLLAILNGFSYLYDASAAFADFGARRESLGSKVRELSQWLQNSATLGGRGSSVSQMCESIVNLFERGERVSQWLPNTTNRRDATNSDLANGTCLLVEKRSDLVAFDDGLNSSYIFGIDNVQQIALDDDFGIVLMLRLAIPSIGNLIRLANGHSPHAFHCYEWVEACFGKDKIIMS